MTIEGVIQYWEKFDAEIDEIYDTASGKERAILEVQRKMVEFTISALRAQQPNVPLTLDELREIDGVVWVCYPQATFGTQLPPTENMSCSRYKFSFADYGKTWLAYRHKPEEWTV